ncbi:hypothetical protein GCM10023196_010830 [Actinoallomurus vinaceus]|uniref:Uncharacterized protein n=1 Tax=Actinoallomurus vinaceus TaxID=1080074 RepID=A0ABP8U509_9ACTN
MHGYVGTEQLPGGDAEEQRVADLTGRAGDGDIDGSASHRDLQLVRGPCRAPSGASIGSLVVEIFQPSGYRAPGPPPAPPGVHTDDDVRTRVPEVVARPEPAPAEPPALF